MTHAAHMQHTLTNLTGEAVLPRVELLVVLEVAYTLRSSTAGPCVGVVSTK